MFSHFVIEDCLSFVSQNALTPAGRFNRVKGGDYCSLLSGESTLSFLFQSQTTSGLSGVPDIGVAVNEGNTQS